MVTIILISGERISNASNLLGKLVFIDVDLYLPTKNALNKIFRHMVKGGYILVDDVQDNRNYDGAFQAYMEFCLEKNIKPIIIGNSFGLIKKE